METVDKTQAMEKASSPFRKSGAAATVLSSSQRVWRACDLPCSALWLLCLFCQGKCQTLSLPAVSLPTGLLGSRSSSTYRGERMGRKQISTSFGKPGCKSLEKVTLDQPCWGLRPGPLGLCLAPSSPAVHRSYQEETRAQKGKGPHSGRELPAYQEVFESPTL